ncbi:LytR/AlgR family response regulator transcription factor [Spirosoma koreense]
MKAGSLQEIKNNLASNPMDWKPISGGSLVLLWLAILQDLLGSIHQNSSFYLSESLLFRGVWLLFIPIIFLQKQLFSWFTYQIRSKGGSIVVTSLSCCFLHAVIFSLLVWWLSLLLFDHTYQPLGTFLYTLSEDLSKYTLVYGAAGVGYFLTENQPRVSPASYPETIWVGTGQQKTNVAIEDIIFITAASPYVVLHTGQKKFIHAESLKSIAAKLPIQHFIRIHKSCIINRQKVVSVKSRLNGDYDIRLVNQVEVRLSRNYVSAFKKGVG